MQKSLDILLVCILIGVAFLVVNLVHFWTLPVSVILYACAIDLVVALLITLPAIIWFWQRKGRLTTSETALSALLASTVTMLYAVMGPTVIDRSLSIYILEKLNQRGGEVAVDRVGDLFVQEYMPEYRLIDVRLTEQLTSGTAEIDGGCLVLTSKGRFLAETMNAYRRVFLPRKRVLRGEMTDQLTRPFDDAPARVDVSCERDPGM